MTGSKSIQAFWTKPVIVLYLIAVLVIPHAVGQETDSLIMEEEISPILIQASRIPISQLRAPQQTFHSDKTQIDPTQNSQDLGTLLSQTPGIVAMNNNNAAQDLRLSIRGFGMRAAFGIRGIRLFVDGIPYTTPDGTGQVDGIWPMLIKNLEVNHGAQSALFGNASGGMIAINTFGDTEENGLNITGAYGSFGNKMLSAEINRSKENKSAQYQLGYHDVEGYRTHSSMTNYMANARWTYKYWNDSEMRLGINFLSSPVAQDPGGVDLDHLQTMRQVARDRNVQFAAGESILQVIPNIQFIHKLDNAELVLNSSYTYRKFDGKLPFKVGGTIDLTRHFINLSLHYIKERGNEIAKLKWLFGIDLSSQIDNRIRTGNNDGNIGGGTLSQDEFFTNYAPFFSAQIDYKKLLLKINARYDYNSISVIDNLTSGGLMNGSRSFSTFSPAVSLSYPIIRHHYLYSSFAYGFETPTLNELTNDPKTFRGLNSELQPMESNTYELGYKGHFSKRMQITANLFYINSLNEIYPYEIEGFSGRSFYRNWGKTRRNGVEFTLKSKGNSWNTYISYAYSNFLVTEDAQSSDPSSQYRMPGIPQHNVSFGAIYKIKGLELSMNGRYISDISLSNDGEKVDGNFVANASVNYSIQTKRTKLVPFFNINNLTNTVYNDNLRINAFGGRYFEPAPGIHFQGGVKIGLGNQKEY